MAYRFPPEHERRIRFTPERSAETGPEPESWRPRSGRVAAVETPLPPKSEDRPKSRPSYAEIDVVEADMSHDSRVERDD